jgi:hypothetical protein
VVPRPCVSDDDDEPPLERMALLPILLRCPDEHCEHGAGDQQTRRKPEPQRNGHGPKVFPARAWGERAGSFAVRCSSPDQLLHRCAVVSNRTVTAAGSSGWCRNCELRLPKIVQKPRTGEDTPAERRSFRARVGLPAQRRAGRPRIARPVGRKLRHCGHALTEQRLFLSGDVLRAEALAVIRVRLRLAGRRLRRALLGCRGRLPRRAARLPVRGLSGRRRALRRGRLPGRGGRLARNRNGRTNADDHRDRAAEYTKSECPLPHSKLPASSPRATLPTVSAESTPTDGVRHGPKDASVDESPAPPEQGVTPYDDHIAAV